MKVWRIKANNPEKGSVLPEGVKFDQRGSRRHLARRDLHRHCLLRGGWDYLT